MAVKIEINAKNMELSDKLRDYVETKVAKLDRYLDIISVLYGLPTRGSPSITKCRKRPII